MVGGRRQTPFFSRVKPQQAPPGHTGPSPVPTGSGQENALQRWRHGQPLSSDPARPRQCGPLPPALHAPTGRSTSSLHADAETPGDVTFWDHVSHSERPGSGPKCQWPSCSCSEFSEPIKDTGHPGTQLGTWTWLEGPLCLWYPKTPQNQELVLTQQRAQAPLRPSMEAGGACCDLCVRAGRPPGVPTCPPALTPGSLGPPGTGLCAVGCRAVSRAPPTPDHPPFPAVTPTSQPGRDPTSNTLSCQLSA